MKLEDQFGTPWHVSTGDPAQTYVNLLKSKGYNWIVLTRATFCGIMESSIDTPQDDRLRHFRLLDCMKEIE